MSYQVLARKWRPQNFHQLVGQSHVKQALVNALNEQRLHHAYLFTGTRGVGKTTIARIFAKSLNCEQGISAEPCGQCNTCLDIEAGRYVDLIEIDAASRTKVEDTREILDNVQYAPTRGKYKVYLIDEVHMLSKHSFNALLKTLEEPPEHVKFLLATTDPQKLPVTILSRCLQFNLSALSVEQISKQLSDILAQEQINFEQQAIELIAKAADGSMRDALSLTDQAIAQTNAALNAQAIKDMLGLMDVRFAQQLLLSALLSDGEGLMEHTQALAKANPNYVAVLDDMLNLCHSIQLTQLVPQAANLSDNDKEFISQCAQEFDTQHIHLLYQLILSGKRDLQYASTAKVGFEMLMLRLLAFEPSAQPSAVPASNAASADEQSDGQAQSKVAALRSLLQKPPKTQQRVPAEPVQPSATTANDSIDTETQASPEPNSAPALDDRQTSEDAMAEQLSSVLDEAADMGYQQSAAIEQPQEAPPAPPVADTEQSPAEQLASMENDAQSAIARILKNRGASIAKAEPSEPTKKNEAHAERASQASAHEQQVKPRQQAARQNKQSAPERIMERHQSNPDNLAPELLAQINPPSVEQGKDEEQAEVIAAPADFVSEVSDIRLAEQKDEWAKTIADIGFSGRVRQFVINSVISKNKSAVTLTVAPKVNALYDDNLHQRIADGLSKHFNEAVQLEVEFDDNVSGTPFLIQQGIDAQRHQEALAAIAQDSNIERFKAQFSATVNENTVKAL